MSGSLRPKVHNDDPARPVGTSDLFALWGAAESQFHMSSELGQNSDRTRPLPCRPTHRNVVSVHEGYELWAQTYDIDPNPLLALEERTLQPLLPNLVGRTVLDVACGTARWLEKMLRGGASSAVGIDLSSGMLEIAKVKPLLHEHLAQGDCLRLPFFAATFDLVICSFAVGHMGSLQAFAQELARVTQRGGDLYLSDLHPVASANGWRTAFRHKDDDVEIPTFAYPVQAICEALICEGFELSRSLEPSLGEPEGAIFAQAGKSHLFQSSCEMPAIFVCQFKRIGFEGLVELSLPTGAI